MGGDGSRSRTTPKTQAPNIFSLPFEILVGQVLAILDLQDLRSLSQACRCLNQLCAADYLWQRKFFNDYQYRPNRTLRQLGGWKRMYKAMDRVEVYTWGSNGDCRLGYGRTPKKVYESVPKRIRRLDGVGIVQLAPTGWGCHALDRHGRVWAWGRIMESNGIRSDAKPRMLKWPRNVVQLAAGRQVILARDTDDQVWQWCRENKAVEVTFPYDIQCGKSTADLVDKIAAGWDLCAALTQSGRIFAWRPPQSADGRYQYRIHVEHSVCLKEQGDFGYEASAVDGDKFVEVAVGSDYVVAVTSLGKVYLFRRLDSPHYRHDRIMRQRQYHNHHPHHRMHSFLQSNFGSVQSQDDREDRIVIETVTEGSLQERVVEIRGRILGAGLHLPIFSEALTHTITETYEELDQRERRRRHVRHLSQQLTVSSFSSSAPPSISLSSSEISREDKGTRDALHRSSSYPTTATANFESFAIHHSSGRVLLGRHDVQSDTRPIIMDQLVSNACQVEFGDHHQGILTEDGQLRTWGLFSEGALGHGNLRTACAVPTVVEGPLKNKFVIGIGMAGWHSACLAIDMSEDKTVGCAGPGIRQPSSFMRGSLLLNEIDGLVDDGYHSLEQSRSHGSGSSCESLDGSDGEERILWRGINNTRTIAMEYPTVHGTTTASSPWTASAASHELLLSSACTASCSLLVSPHSHRHGSESNYSRPSPLRKRSLSMAEKDQSHRLAQDDARGYRCHHGNTHGSCGHCPSVSRGDKAPVLAMTRLNPILKVYEPVSVEAIALQLSQL
ncbi:hypothetical protein BGX28_004801 [Mortierella sp. GBA30]|nr:hypothetical protein BGX28_004801 [Mortierella sp. GBA30]